MKRCTLRSMQYSVLMHSCLWPLVIWVKILPYTMSHVIKSLVVSTLKDFHCFQWVSDQASNVFHMAITCNKLSMKLGSSLEQLPSKNGHLTAVFWRVIFYIPQNAIPLYPLKIQISTLHTIFSFSLAFPTQCVFKGAVSFKGSISRANQFICCKGSLMIWLQRQPS